MWHWIKWKIVILWNVLLQIVLVDGLFRIDRIQMTQPQAINYCNSIGMQLIKVNNTNVNTLANQFIISQGINDRIWMSMSCINGICRWSDNEVLTWAGWQSTGEPAEQCVVFDGIGSYNNWRTRKCDDVFFPFCYAPDTMTTQSTVGTSTTNPTAIMTTQLMDSTSTTNTTDITATQSTVGTWTTNTTVLPNTLPTNSTIITADFTNGIAEMTTEIHLFGSTVNAISNSEGGVIMNRTFHVEEENAQPNASPYKTISSSSTVHCAIICFRYTTMCSAFVFDHSICSLYNSYQSNNVLQSVGSVIWT